jgi:hypothetical protein
MGHRLFVASFRIFEQHVLPKKIPKNPNNLSFNLIFFPSKVLKLES